MNNQSRGPRRKDQIYSAFLGLGVRRIARGGREGLAGLESADRRPPD